MVVTIDHARGCVHSHTSDPLFCGRSHEFDLILYLANEAILDKNGVLDILNHMVNLDFMLGQRRRQLTYINPVNPTG